MAVDYHMAVWIYFIYLISEALDDQGVTPLYTAAFGGWPVTAQVLLDKGASHRHTPTPLPQPNG